MCKIFIIIPAYNEENTIEQVVCEVLRVNAECGVVVVDDNSNDDTAACAQNAGAVVLRHCLNRGQGAALKTGTEYALGQGADIIVHFDADGQFLPPEIKDIAAPLLNGEADIVFGSRFLGKPSNMPWLKKNILMPLARGAQKNLFGIKITDPQSGFRAFTKEAFLKIRWHNDRMAHCSEILHLSFKNKLRVKEVPATVIYKEFGQKFSGGFKIIKDLFLGSFTD